MTFLVTIILSVAIFPAVSSIAMGQQRGDPNQVQRTADARPQEAKPEQVREAEPKAKPKQQARRREPVKVVDIAPETATHLEGKPLSVTFKRLTALRICEDDSLLACDAGAKVIKIIDPAGELVGTIPLPFAPEALDIAADGTLYCGGEGQLAKLNSEAEILTIEKVPDDVAPGSTEPAESRKPEPTAAQPPKSADSQAQASGDREPSKSDVAAKELGKGNRKKPAPQRRRRKPRPKRISGIAVTDRDAFVAFGTGWSLGSKSKLYRFNLDLKDPKFLAEGLRGCCQRCDIKSQDAVLYLAENSAHRVVLYDRDGTVLEKWGERGRNDLKTFGACCNPMNICFDGHGVIYTAESGLGRIKRYTPDGEFLDLVGYVGTDRFWNGSGLAASCSNMAIAVTNDGHRVYVMDYKNSQIRVLEKKATENHAETR